MESKSEDLTLVSLMQVWDELDAAFKARNTPEAGKHIANCICFLQTGIGHYTINIYQHQDTIRRLQNRVMELQEQIEINKD